MASLTQVVEQVRFALGQLSAKNAHHEFEHLCRHLARARICSNILPATGPVSAGGDQGRDFETFRTYIQDQGLSNSVFLELISKGTIAFACTLEKTKGLPNKIKKDIATILASGTAVQDVHYFTGDDLPTAKRHELQEWAKVEHKVDLEIHDGQSISELLADSEVFWIATAYLKIPSEIYPTTNDEKNRGGSDPELSESDLESRTWAEAEN